MTEQDSIQTSFAATAVTDTVVRQYSRPQTPYQVLRLLPKDATPAQQDSAVQAWLKPVEIRYSEQPDTLHLPGEEIPRDLKTVNLPLFYRENYFSNDTLYHEELKAGGSGVAGDPVPNTINNDDVLTGLLILCFLFIAFALSRISGFIAKQLKDFFYIQRGEHTITETGNEMKFQMVFIGMTCLVYGLLYYLYATNYVADTFTLSSDYAILGIFVGAFAIYFVIRFLLYHIVNTIFFDSKKNKKFLTSLLFLSAMEGAALFPVVLLLAYLHFPAVYAIYYCAIVLILVKILTFYKSYIIFFKQNAGFLQIFLYFCALEMVPLFALLGGLAGIVDIFKIKF
ncbi:MAG: DUF4271 domain-containing protein [Prevotella sp.]|nr:DUF4271 domain-containing protein [Prevotella sp.]